MAFTRPRRRLVFGAVLVTAMLALVLLLGYKRSGKEMAIAGPYHTHGLTGWLMVYEFGNVRMDGSWSQRRYQVNPEGLLGAAGMIVVAGLACWWVHRRLVGVLALEGRCDWCGYDLTGTTSGRCPECGVEA